MEQTKSYGEDNQKNRLLPMSSKLTKYYIWLGIMAALIILVTFLDF